MNCYVHQDLEAVATCSRCGRAVCASCAIAVGSSTVCRGCLAAQQVPQPGVKSVDTAFILELLPGLFGFLGIGYLYMGRTQDGVIRLVGWFLIIVIGWVAAALLASVLIGFLCMPVLLVAQIGVPIWSALTLKKELLAGSTLA